MTTPGDSVLPAAHASDKAAPWPTYVTASVAWHAGAGLFAIAVPPAWPWAVAAVAANHAVLTALMSDRSAWRVIEGETARRSSRGAEAGSGMAGGMVAPAYGPDVS